MTRNYFRFRGPGEIFVNVNQILHHIFGAFNYSQIGLYFSIPVCYNE